MQPQVNPDMVVLARESRGFTQSALAEKLTIPQTLLSRIEHGIKSEIPESIFNGLSEKLFYPKSFFYQNGHIMPISTQLQYRRRVNLKAQDQKRIEAEANIARLHIKKMLQDFNIETNIKYFYLDEYNGSPEAIAKAARLFWKVPRGRINNVTELLESNGIIVVSMNFNSPLVDGFSIYDGKLPPQIFINNDVSGDRFRFTLTHELGHILMHNTHTVTMEDEAHRFAAEFLMPEVEISAELQQNLDIPRLADLKQYWQVSMAAIAMRAKNLGKITDGQYRYLCMKMSSAGYRKREPVEIPQEKPKLLQSLVNSHLDQLGYSIEDLSRILCINTDEFQSIYVPTFNKLRLTK